MVRFDNSDTRYRFKDETAEYKHTKYPNSIVGWIVSGVFVIYCLGCMYFACFPIGG